MKAIIQFLGAGSRESGSHSLYMFLDQHRMLVNVSEGTQRISTQHRLKLAPSRLSTILLTRLDWECIGGLPGLILTMADSLEALKSHPDASRHRSAKVPALKIVGPRHLRHAIAAMRPFLHRHNFAVEVEEIESKQEAAHFFDTKTGVNYWALELNTDRGELQTAAGESSSLRKRSCLERVENLVIETDPPNATATPPLAQHFLMKMFKSEYTVNPVSDPDGYACLKRERTAGRLPRDFVCQGSTSLAYLLQGPVQPGKFDRNAAVAAGVPPGPLFGQLGRGEAVVLPDGRTVLPSECVGLRRPSAAVLILDLANEALVKAAVARLAALVDLIQKPTEGRTEAVFHLLGEQIDMESYTELVMKPLSQHFPHIQHFVSAPNNSLLFPSSIALQNMLARELAAPEHFVSGEQPASFASSTFARVARPFDKLCLYPELSFEAAQEASEGESDLQHLAAASAEGAVTVSALGTGAALPGKYRNVSSTLLETPEGNLFLDCGEGTIGQVFRMFGPERARKVLGRVTAVLVSHLHGDHHLGALSLIRTVVESAEGRRLKVVAPARFQTWLEEIGQVTSFGLEQVEFVACGEVKEEGFGFEGVRVKPFDVDHCQDAYGFLVALSDGCRIVYSGDTRPCQNTIVHAAECDLLIHEATLSNDLVHEAVFRKHCTIGEALDVSAASRAKRTLLTHFSQRYAKGALSISDGLGNVAMAVDLFRFDLTDFAKVAAFTGRLPGLLPVDDGDVDEEEGRDERGRGTG